MTHDSSLHDTARRDAAADTPLLILVIEDEFLTRWAAAEFLRDSGYRVIEAENAKAAVSVFESGTLPDVVFSDVNMPGEADGHRFASWLAQAHPALPMILTSGSAAEAARVRLGPLRIFVRKPYDLNEIARLIETLR